MGDAALKRTTDMRRELGIYNSLAELLASADNWAPGEVLLCLAENRQYTVAAAGASDHDEITRGGEKLYDTDLTSDKEYRSLGFTANTPAGGITKAISFFMTTVYDRCWAAWYDSSNRLRVALGYHTNTTGDDVHEAWEIKTSDDPGGGTPDNMETRLSIGTDAADVTASFNSVHEILANYDGTNELDIDLANHTVDFGSGANEAWTLTAGGRSEWGYNGGSAFFGAPATKALNLYSNGASGSPQIVLGTGGQVMMSTLPTSDPTNAGQLWNNSGVVTVSAG